MYEIDDGFKSKPDIEITCPQCKKPLTLIYDMGTTLCSRQHNLTERSCYTALCKPCNANINMSISQRSIRD